MEGKLPQTNILFCSWARKTHSCVPRVEVKPAIARRGVGTARPVDSLDGNATPASIPGVPRRLLHKARNIMEDINKKLPPLLLYNGKINWELYLPLSSHTLPLSPRMGSPPASHHVWKNSILGRKTNIHLSMLFLALICQIFFLFLFLWGRRLFQRQRRVCLGHGGLADDLAAVSLHYDHVFNVFVFYDFSSLS